MRVIAIIASLAWVLVSCLAYTASAYDLGCQFEWNGPDSENNVGDCLKEYPSRYPGMLIPTAIPVFFFIFLLFCFPMAFCGRCCGMCGSNNQRPGAGCCCDGREWDFAPDEEKAKAYHTVSGHLCCLKVCAVLLFIGSAVAVVLMPLGAGLALEGWQYAIDHVETDVLKWIEDKRDDLVLSLTGSDGSLPAPLDNDSFSMLTDTLNDCRDFNDNLRSATDTWVSAILIASIAFACVPALGMFFVLIFAMCNCRKFLPACFQCFFFPLGLLFNIFSAVFLTLGLFLIIFHGEAELQANALPGLFGWYMVPYCEAEFKFQEAKDVVNDAIATASYEGCIKMLEICDASPTVANPSDTNEKKQFHCPALATGNITQLCKSTSDLRYYFNNTYAKSNSLICADASTMTWQNCSIAQCTTQCVITEFQEVSKEASNELSIGERGTKALAKAFLFADCDILLAQIVKPLAKINLGGSGFYVGGAGACVGALCFMLGIMLLFKGQKEFVAMPVDAPF